MMTTELTDQKMIASRFLLVCLALACIYVGWLFYLLISSAEEVEARQREQWAGALVVKICRDGTHIFKLNDGSYRTGSWHSQQVHGPEVCQ